MANDKLITHAVILAGGRGTRFWPRSRTRTPKHLLKIVGQDTMLQQTVARLKPLLGDARVRTVTSAELASGGRTHVPGPARGRGLFEPQRRHSAVARVAAGIPGR